MLNSHSYLSTREKLNKLITAKQGVVPNCLHEIDINQVVRVLIVMTRFITKPVKFNLVIMLN